MSAAQEKRRHCRAVRALLALILLAALCLTSGCAGAAPDSPTPLPAAPEPTPAPLETAAPEPSPAPTPRPQIDRTPVTEQLPEVLFQPCPQPGRLEDLTYSKDGESREKPLQVYLPYGYDPERAYNVLILLHGDNGSAQDWLETEWEASGLSGRQILDQCVYTGVCEPLIVASFYTGYVQSPDYRAVAAELRNDVLPTLVAHYSTYASPDGSDLPLQREHFALAGLSSGAILTQSAGMMESMDLFAWFGCFSFGYPNSYQLLRAMEERYPELPVRYLYVGCGTGDYTSEREGVYQARHYAAESYRALTKESGGRITEGKNACFTWLNGGHDWKTWHMALYNMTLLFFTEESAG